MSTSSLGYLAFLVAAVVAFSAGRGAPLRRLLLSAANAVFLAFFVDSWANAGLLAAFVLGGYVAVRLAEPRATRAAVPLWPLILAPAALLVYVKRYSFLTLVLPARTLAHGLEIVGLSYMTFKLIHMLVDAREGALAPVSLPCYANYQLGFFTLAAGPIQRYNDFARWWDAPEPAPDAKEALEAWSRILDGLLKAALLGTLALKLYEAGFEGALSGAPGRGTLLKFLLAFYAYPFYIYLNFSGYCDVVIGGARLFGLTLPENFDLPFLARNMLEFWNRWHITLTFWIRDYVFMSSYRAVAVRWTRLRKPAGYVLLFSSLLVAGVWHGSTWNFFIFGALHGLGVMTAEVYGDVLSRTLGPDGVKRYLSNRWIRLAAILVTFHFVCFTFLVFPSDLGRTAAMLRNVAASLGRR